MAPSTSHRHVAVHGRVGASSTRHSTMKHKKQKMHVALVTPAMSLALKSAGPTSRTKVVLMWYEYSKRNVAPVKA